tara:strand:+ start:349 stop:717 length:369 start_codon:yes stop_codon:yes gene_type:complete
MKKTENREIQKMTKVVSSPIFSPHSLVASVSIVPRIEKIPIIIPSIKNQIPESNTPSKTGRTLEITGKSLLGYSIPYRIRKTIVETDPRTRRIHDEGGSLSPCRNSPDTESSPSAKTPPHNT